MKQKRAVYASFVADHRALISPIRHMPPDVLRNIFSHCVPHSAPEKVMQASEAPLLLAQICRHWRDLVISTPTLWSTIFVMIPEPPQLRPYPHVLPYDTVDVQENGDIDVEAEGAQEALLASLVDGWNRKMESLIGATTTWLSRAEGCPLMLFLQDTYSNRLSIIDATLIHESVDLLLSFICARSSQWAQLDLQVTESSSSAGTFLSLSPSQAPQLQSIRTQWSPAYGGPPDRSYSPPLLSSSSNNSNNSDVATPKPSLHIFKAARLRHLYLENFSGNFKDIPVAWSNLTELSCTRPSHRYLYPNHEGGVLVGESFGGEIITDFTPSVALALLQQCPNLVQCELHLSEARSGDGAVTDESTVPTRHVHLPYLQRFVVSEQRQGPSLTFFKSLIDLPLLTSMSWKSLMPQCDPYPYPGAPPPPPPPHLSPYPLLSALGHQIQCLEFGTIAASITQLVDCLKLAVGVTELTIDMSNLISPVDIVPLEGPPSGDGPHVIMAQQWKPPRPFYRDEVVTSLTPTSNSEASSMAAETTICPNLAILRLVLGHPTNITTKALKNLVTLRNRSSPGHSWDSIHHTAPLTQVTVRFVDTGNPGGYHHGRMPTPVFPKRWEEDQLNSGFSRRVIKVERPRKFFQGDLGMNIEVARRTPFETYWDFESNHYEPSRP
ncbi:hypothetical protein BKA70DRAFT_1269247 [Coprinopsis sp. MPI-PUGE-AT-0042]|nr:hypothetical protein BKA70DRAFT_1269247 [Coprinopsis sp. MPI-PUGE-AT-0042]